ncbi:thiamine phosphate synthase [Cocleimonas sp. KMM 6892]|uniref:thiamine phosphate synthase n=1 Tax=unclassified Cocleimonas TaxID=2639732 RepID=UPI002DB6A570|nr:MULTISPECIES: thiamine phosphate synthase [unclassified Cocleimonas]MEB8433764.1 thiamine phosphate synthase [Cocleimonas sp. KMM 6892]MEC4716575.1 thiamine phosphate synthase [Cocleimonas sp. KMM 6895]MEC4746270.1 thiamine phosphate synthase [Cocleimonas sp. KMM 6896]
MSKILLIGGTDPSGAGLQTDWQVAHHLGVNASSVVSAVTSQNSEGVFDQGVLAYSQIKSQLGSVKSEPFTVIKIGMLGNADAVKAVVEFIASYNQLLKSKHRKAFVIADPVLASSSGGALMDEAGKQAFLTDLFPLITLITPNSDELESLTGISISNEQDLEAAAQQLITLGAKNVLVKGGHLYNANDTNQSNDLFVSVDGSANIKGEEESFYLSGERWKNRSNVRGTGCSLATAIACQLSLGFPLNDSIVYAKALISNGIRNASLTENNQYKLQFSHYDTHHPFELMDMPKLVKHAEMLSKSFDFACCDAVSDDKPDNIICNKEPNNKLGIYPVVDSLEWLQKLIPLGIKTIQLRIKDQQPDDVEEDIIAAIKLAKKYNVRLFINDYWQLAVKHQAYGIHLGQEDLDDADMASIAQSGCRLGVSTHSYTEVARTLAINPSYIALGPIYETTSKIMPWIPQGVTAVEKWVNLLGKQFPLVAIGGINYQRAADLKQTGIGSVAMISAIIKTENYELATEELLELWEDV